jgi:hypothetical protein
MVFAWDSTQGTAADRLKVYVNNELITAWRSDIGEGLDPASDEVFRWNNINEECFIGQAREATSEFDGYIAEFHNIDGQQLTPSSFGEAGTYGEWKPKEVTGMTYGNNGFYLPFKSDYEVEGFSIVTYPGNGVHDHYIGGTGFSPDLVWIKSRDNDSGMRLFDAVELASNALLLPLTESNNLIPESLSLLLIQTKSGENPVPPI